MMKIKSKLKRIKTVCGVELLPGENKYKGLSLKDSVQRFKLLALRDAGMIDFKSDDKLGEKDLPKPPKKKEESEKKEEVANGTDVQADSGAIKKARKNGNADSGKGAVSDKAKNKSK